MLENSFFDRDTLLVTRKLVGKIIRSKYHDHWLAAKIIETEAYFKKEKGSHASLGLTEKRKALFMPPGTIYMYFARGGDSLNISCSGSGNAVLIKAAIPYSDSKTSPDMLAIMQRLNPMTGSGLKRKVEWLCSGQTLLCRSLNIKVVGWDKKNFHHEMLFIEDVGITPVKLVKARRLGIPQGRDENLLYRFVDFENANYATSNPMSKRQWQAGIDYEIIRNDEL
ncbi:MAG: DNA-3-methyladenine glycosylase [Candidatus Neomarinimicrobiota bacterium]